MTQSQTVNVEYEELMARADELEQPLPAIPPTNPAAPCALSLANDAAAQLALSAESMRLYLNGCEREWKSLAKSLRKAARAYQEADEVAADSINGEGGGSGGNGRLCAYDDPEGDSGWSPPPPPPPPAPFDYPYYEVRQATMDIEDGDQGAAFGAFAHDWDNFQRTFQEEAYRFRPFTCWEGDARTAVEQNFEQQRAWIYSMVQLCATLSKQAIGVVDAQKKLRSDSGSADEDSDGNYLIPEQHPGPIDVSNCDYWYKFYVEADPESLHYAIAWYARMQKQSEGALKLYVANASLPLPPVNPGMFPTASVSDFDLKSEIFGDGQLEDLPLDLPGDDSLGGLTGMPTLPGLGMPSMPDESKLAGAAAGPPVPAVGSGSHPLTGSGVKPASLGGGGIGVVPPLRPLTSSFSQEPSPAPATNGYPGLGRGVPGAGAALGGGGMGMPPMAPNGAHGKGAEKGKRLQDERALYTERRAWTEGIIGRSRGRTSPEKEIVKPLAYARLDGQAG
ncbi:PPE domain-containing protein [Mycobacterium lentiflavum]|uniref:Alanine and glycine rich protein n=1 Tax=Mycobacterium lentiflavum TaxID=141349 RepID=A0ABY3V142_MYCLN|nr:hypothetical protein [Mycobacterium lentiflavum]ULP43664.1 hypothetical protein MJO58_06780 [Mycobacterium lentiflavum]